MSFWVVLLLLVSIGCIILPFKLEAENKRKTRVFEELITQTLYQKGFSIDKKYEFAPCRVLLDYQHRRGAFLPLLALPQDYRKTPMSAMQLFPLDQITECALVQDGTMVHHDAVIAGMAGAALFGLGGAVAGSTAMSNAEHVGHLSVRLFLDNQSIPSLTVTALNISMIKSSDDFLKLFDNTQQLYNEFEGIVRMNRRTLEAREKQPMPLGSAPADSAAAATAQAKVDGNARILEQIKHLAAMHTEGILTDEEFAKKKTMLLDRMI